MAGGPCVCKFGMPFTGNHLEGFRLFCLCLFLGFANGSGVYAMCNLFSGFISTLPGFKEGYFRICTQREEFFLIQRNDI